MSDAPSPASDSASGTLAPAGRQLLDWLDAQLARHAHGEDGARTSGAPPGEVDLDDDGVKFGPAFHRPSTRAEPAEPWARITARTVATLAAGFDHFDWTGIYLLEGDELILGPFVGAPTEHARIPVGEGICGAAVAEEDTVVVDDVRDDPRYLACFATTRSEIVVPIITPQGRIVGEIDVDSDSPAAFGKDDRALLEAVCGRLALIASALGEAP